jgi:ribosomal protein L34
MAGVRSQSWDGAADQQRCSGSAALSLCEALSPSFPSHGRTASGLELGFRHPKRAKTGREQMQHRSAKKRWLLDDLVGLRWPYVR